MRVISGRARGHKLLAPKGISTRPTTDRIKETLFNMISSYIPDSRFLDLFGGTGAIGIEALSRGALSAVFIDNSEEAIRIIETNLKSTKLFDKAKVIKSDFLSAFKKLEGKQFDIIYIDPPYISVSAAALSLKAIADYGVLADDGLIIIEQASDKKMPELFGFNLQKIKQFKTTHMLFINKNLEN